MDDANLLLHFACHSSSCPSPPVRATHSRMTDRLVASFSMSGPETRVKMNELARRRKRDRMLPRDYYLAHLKLMQPNELDDFMRRVSGDIYTASVFSLSRMLRDLIPRPSELSADVLVEARDVALRMQAHISDIGTRDPPSCDECKRLREAFSSLQCKMAK